MLPANDPLPGFRLSPEAFAELKKITIAEYDDTMTDEEIHEMGVRLLRIFDLLSRNLPEKEDPPPQRMISFSRKRTAVPSRKPRDRQR